jgi:hypothetical protein
MKQAVIKRNGKFIIMLVAILCLIVYGVKKDAYVIYNYDKAYNEPINNECQNFKNDYQVYFKNNQAIKELNPTDPEPKGFSVSEHFSFFLYNQKLFNAANIENVKLKDLADVDLIKFCFKFHQNEMIEKQSYNNAPSLFSSSFGLLNYHKLRIVVNIAAGLFGALMLFFILKEVKSESEGFYRLLILSAFIMASIPYFIDTYSVFVTPQTQSITFPASILLVFYLIYKLYKWIADGFTKSNLR